MDVLNTQLAQQPPFRLQGRRVLHPEYTEDTEWNLMYQHPTDLKRKKIIHPWYSVRILPSSVYSVYSVVRIEYE
jgi:hypothetical protein